MKTCLQFRTLSNLILVIAFIFSLCPAMPVAAQTAGAPIQTLQTAASWLDAQEYAGIVYLLYSSPAQIKRFDLNTGDWLPDILLADIPTTFTVSPTELYIAFGRRVSKFDLNGTGEFHLVNTTYNIVSLHIANQLLFVNYSYYPYGHFLSYNLITGTVIDDKSFLYDVLVGVSVAPTIGKLFGRDTGISPSDIVQISYNSEGVIGPSSDSPYHGAYPSARKTWVLPGERMVVDDSGIIYNTADLTYRNSLAGKIDDLAFYGDLPIVLRDGTLISYSNIFLETGRYTPENRPQRIFVFGETIYSFFAGSLEPEIESIPISMLNPAVPGAPVDPNGLSYVPDQVLMGNDEVVYLLSKKYQSIFRWDVAQRHYISTIPLFDVPYSFAFASSQNRIYVVYPSGKIQQIRLNEDQLETPFANLPTAPCGLATAGSIVFTCDHSGAWVAHSTFSPNGELVSKKDWNYFSQEYIWNEARQKMYFFRDDTSPNDLIWEDISTDGLIGEKKDSPYHSSTGIIHPIRVKEDGSIVLLGSGRIYNGLTLEQVNALSNNITDAVWKNNNLYTLRSYNNASQLQAWDTANYGVTNTQSLFGSPLRLFSIQEGFLTITNLSGKTRFSIYAEDFSPIALAPLANFSATPLAGDVPLEVVFSNLSTEGSYTEALWDFGDGTTSTEINPTHLYTQSGTFTVSLTVTGPGGNDTLVCNSIIQVQPVKANFEYSISRGVIPLTVQFSNLTTGAYDTISWDFGDGDTSNEANPSHTYATPGLYTVTLSVDGPYGSDTNTKSDLIFAFVIQNTYLPFLNNPQPLLYVAPGIYNFDNICRQTSLYIRGMYVAQLRECVPGVEVKDDGTMYFSFSWTAFMSPTADGCLTKYSDAGNRDMYIEDGDGYRYDHTEVGGEEYVYCMESGVSYVGWFKFPPATHNNTTFTFYDDDNGIQLSPIILPAP